MKTLVVAAHNNEDVAWVKPLAFESDWSVIVNSTYQPPGRESHAILTYFQNREESILADEEIVFCQGNPFDHDPDFIRNLGRPEIRHYGTVHECDHNAAPAYEACLDHWCDVLGLTPPPHVYRFSAGSQYRVTGAQVHSRPWALYKTMLALTESNPASPWVFERLWPTVWGINL